MARGIDWDNVTFESYILGDPNPKTSAQIQEHLKKKPVTEMTIDGIAPGTYKLAELMEILMPDLKPKGRRKAV